MEGCPDGVTGAAVRDRLDGLWADVPVMYGAWASTGLTGAEAVGLALEAEAVLARGEFGRAWELSVRAVAALSASREVA